MNQATLHDSSTDIIKWVRRFTKMVVAHGSLSANPLCSRTSSLFARHLAAAEVDPCF